MNFRALVNYSGKLFLLLAITGSAYASSGSHPGDNPLIVGGSFGLLFTFFSWVTADQFSNTPQGNYNGTKWISGLVLSVVFALCLALILDGKSESGLKTFAAIGYLFFALPQAALIYFSRKSALQNEQENRLAQEESTLKQQAVFEAPVVKKPVHEKSKTTSKSERKEPSAKIDVDGLTRSVGLAPGSADEKTVKPRAKKSSAKAGTIELGVFCTDLRYSEEEHGATLPAAFKRARDAWRLSGNDPSSPHYSEACKLLSKWYSSYFQVRLGFAMSMSIDEDNLPESVKSVVFKDASEAAEHTFSGEPTLKSCQVVFVDFRSSTSNDLLRDDEKILKSPEVGVLAIYEAKLGKKVKDAAALMEILQSNESILSECFHIEIKSEAIETVSVDDEGDEVVSSSSSWSGGDISIKVNLDEVSDIFKTRMTDEIRSAHQTKSLLGESASSLKKLIMLADEDELKKVLDGGLDVNTTVEDEPLLKLSLMVGVTAEQWFNHQETSEPIQAKFPKVDLYRAALKRIALDLLNRGADVNAPSGHLSILAVAEALNDEEVVTLCRERAGSANDGSSAPFLLAAERGDVDALKELLSKGARINKREFLHGTTPLMIACQGPGGEDAPPLAGEALSAQVAAVKFLIEHGAEIDARSDTGDTAIGNAVRRGNALIVEILITAGAKTTSALPRKRSLLALAKERGHINVVQLLQRNK